MLMTCRSPLRVSFFGGGTDYPEYFARRHGAVVGMAINKYIYITLLRSLSFLNYNYRVAYSKLELSQAVDEINHPVVRAVLKEYGVLDSLDIGVQADLPANSGLGSSSAFTVGFLHLIATLQGKALTKLDLARRAIHIERDVLCERVGVQDQLHSAFGGINRFDFERERIRITPLQMTTDCMQALTDSLVLVFTGLTRHASATLDEQLLATKEHRLDNDLQHLIVLANQSVNVLEGESPDRMLQDFGAMMHEGWLVKRALSKKISNPHIDELYDLARRHGALGGKLCGAGSGGFLLMVVPAHAQLQLVEAVAPAHVIKISMDVHGSTVLYS
jgi:D-glycero-alpha-D-manno-heptose-7-phosphate kinase